MRTGRDRVVGQLDGFLRGPRLPEFNLGVELLVRIRRGLGRTDTSAEKSDLSLDHDGGGKEGEKSLQVGVIELVHPRVRGTISLVTITCGSPGLKKCFTATESARRPV